MEKPKEILELEKIIGNTFNQYGVPKLNNSLYDYAYLCGLYTLFTRNIVETADKSFINSLSKELYECIKNSKFLKSTNKLIEYF